MYCMYWNCWPCVASIACYTKCKRESGLAGAIGFASTCSRSSCEKKGFIVAVDCKSALLAKNIARAREEKKTPNAVHWMKNKQKHFYDMLL